MTPPKYWANLARIKLAKLFVRLLLPRDLWLGNHKGAYTQKWSVHLGVLDSRGVLQGIEDRHAAEGRRR